MFFFFSSLLIVYEGFEEIPIHPMDVCFQGVSVDCCLPFNDAGDDVDNDDIEHIDKHDTDGSRSSPYCYDADASNDSAEMNLSSSHEDSDHNHHQILRRHHLLKHASKDHDDNVDDEDNQTSNIEVSAEAHQRGFGEAAARGAKGTQPFIPISEDTVFLDPEPPMPSISTSSPLSGDSWMNYSSNSSDDYSGLSEQIKAVTSGRQTGKILVT